MLHWAIIFFVVAFVLFILDIKATAHGALTIAGIASFIVGALVLFNSPGTPQFQRVSVPLVIATGLVLHPLMKLVLIGLLWAFRWEEERPDAKSHAPEVRDLVLVLKQRFPRHDPGRLALEGTDL